MRWLPSALSVSRIFFTPPIAAAILAGHYPALFCCVGWPAPPTILMGFWRGAYGWASRTGAWLDAISDKVLLSTIYVCFALTGDVPLWLVALVLGRDVMI
jgi:cardiolipin synthase